LGSFWDRLEAKKHNVCTDADGVIIRRKAKARNVTPVTKLVKALVWNPVTCQMDASMVPVTR
jgi:hypothetical protein